MFTRGYILDFIVMVMIISFARGVHVKLCKPCDDSHTDIYPVDKIRLYNDVIDNVISLARTTVEGLCRYYNDIYEGDISPVDITDPSQITVNQRQFNYYPMSDIVTVYDKLTSIAMYYKLGSLQRQYTEGLTLPHIDIKIRYTLCALQRVSNETIPVSVCSKSLVLRRQPINRAEFGSWIFSILQKSRHELCEVFNAVAPRVGESIITCNQLPEVSQICSK